MHIGERSAFSLTRFGNWPVVIPVFDGHYKENGFFQVMSLFGLIVVVCTIECNEAAGSTQMEIDWAIASHRLLRFLHPLLNRRLQRLNDVQNREDDQMRDRRIELREAGYRFETDRPDFINSNVVANNVVFPPVDGIHSVSVADLAEGEARSVKLGDRAYVVRRKSDALELWPGVCPHEGAAIKEGDLRGSTIKCPWHGLEFGPRRLVAGGSSVTVCGARVQIVDGLLTMQSAQAAGSQP